MQNNTQFLVCKLNNSSIHVFIWKIGTKHFEHDIVTNVYLCKGFVYCNGYDSTQTVKFFNQQFLKQWNVTHRRFHKWERLLFCRLISQLWKVIFLTVAVFLVKWFFIHKNDQGIDLRRFWRHLWTQCFGLFSVIFFRVDVQFWFNWPKFFTRSKSTPNLNVVTWWWTKNKNKNVSLVFWVLVFQIRKTVLQHTN